MRFDPDTTLWYRHSARTWNEALPLGNGRLGLMDNGDAVSARIWLNEDSLWSGYPTYYENEDAAAWYLKARDLAAKHDYAAAQEILEKHCTGLATQAYLPLGEIGLSFSYEEDPTDYTRSLDLSTGIHTVSYRVGETQFTRESFVSAPDQVAVIRITADQPGQINVQAQLNPAINASVRIDPDTLSFTGNAPVINWVYNHHQNATNFVEYGTTEETSGMGFHARMLVRAEGGRVMRSGSGLLIFRADSLTLFFNARTGFNGWNRHPVTEGREFVAPCCEELAAASAKDYETLKQAHIADHRSLYDRVCMKLEEAEPCGLPTDERLYRHENGREDLSLYTLYFNFGRYLTVSASRAGTQPTNLQGIWNPHLVPPWNCNYTVNINTEMNYWPTLPIRLPECFEPFVQLQKDLSEAGERTARDYYDAPGYVAHHNTDLWRMTTSVGMHCEGTASWSNWPMASGWMADQLYEAYAFTQDKELLQKTVYPVMKKAVSFYLPLLTRNAAGHWILSPASSPENCFVLGETRKAVAEWTAMTQCILKDLFEDCITAAETLKTDEALQAQLKAVLAELEFVSIGRDGELMEWNENFEESELHHRHISHLYGMYPGHSISPKETPELAAAVKQSLLRRGDESTGWAMGWRICQWARLLDGDHAKHLLDNQLRTVDGHNPEQYNYRNGGGTYLNLFDAHPPFQIDGNYGATAGICEMFLQSQNGVIDLLPALPTSWRNGSITGLLARGAVTVDIAWEKGLLKQAKLYPAGASVLRVRAQKPVRIGCDGSAVPVREEKGCAVFETEAGRVYTVEIL